MERKRGKKTKFNKTVVVRNVIIIAMLIAAILLFVHYFNKGDNKNEEVKPSENISKKIEEPKEEVHKASMVMVGDMLLHSSVYKEANRNAGYSGYDFKPMFEYIAPIVSKYDIAYYNQETILGGEELGLSDYPCFNSPYDAGNDMISMGFNLVSLATNHTLDRGKKAVINSRAYWDKQEKEKGVLAAGSYISEEQRNEIKIREANGIKYTMLSYTYGTNGIPVPKDAPYLVNVWPTDLNINDPSRDTKYQEYKETVKEDIARVKDKVDVLFIAMHWGVEYTNTPTAYEIDSANFLAEQGVNIVIGAHPHVVQPVTFIGDTLVIYSLGNFISAQEQNQNYNKMVELMTSVDITKTVKGDETKITLSNISNELLYNYHKGYRNFKVIPFSQMDSDHLANYKDIYEKYKKVIQMYNEDMYVVPVAE